MSWAAEEFATVNLGHKWLNKRLNKRLVKVVQQWADKPTQSIPDGAEPSFAMRPQPPCVPRRVLLPPRAFMRVGDGSKP